MSSDCFDTNQFENIDGLNPYPWLQYRHVSSQSVPSYSLSYGPREGSKDILIHELDVTWTNSSPIPQYAYGLISRSPSVIVGTGRSSQTIQVIGGQTVGVAPPRPGRTMLDSIHGGGFDAGSALSLAMYSVWEDRARGGTLLFGETQVVNPGESWRGWASCRYVHAAADTSGIYGGNNETEMRFTSGATQIDVYAYPKLD